MGKINAGDFVEMFMAISYAQEQRVIRLSIFDDYLKEGYLHHNFGAAEEVLAIDRVVFDKILEMIRNKILVAINLDDRYGLYRVTDKIDFRGIIEKNRDNLEEMIQIFYGIYNDKFVPTEIVLDNKEKSR